MNWGASKSTVKQFMTGYTLKSETTDLLVYGPKDEVVETQYQFKNGKLSMSVVGIYESKVSAEEITGFLKERYTYLGPVDSEFYFVSNDKKTGVVLELQKISTGEYLYVVYYLNNASSSSPIKTFKNTVFPSATVCKNTNINKKLSTYLNNK